MPSGSRIDRQPVVFIGHGSPMNAIASNEYSKSLRLWGDKLRTRRPRAAIFFSAHWETDGLQVLTIQNPRTIHDFYGFPKSLFEVQYPAPGDPALATRVVNLLSIEAATPTAQWGFDHGVWSVLRHMWPEADLPIVMVSLSKRLDPETHFRVGQLLRPLRDEGVLIMGSGNIVHNLKEMQRDESASPHPWAIEFDERIKKALIERDEKTLISASRSSDAAARKAVPTREHYLPLLPVVGASFGDESVRFIADEIQNASISMRSAVFGFDE